MSNQRPLALRCPLRGSRLIEASAGTGKTFTISALYLRLVLGHGEGDNAFSRELLPPDVLVVTFTEAATQELRDRIRARLVEGAQAFRGELTEPDPILSGLLADIPEAEHASAARKLDIAAQWMDQAAVSTIHSWCQRMLREHAFDSGSLFTQTLETDQRDLLAEVARDYWRLHCYHLHGSALAWVQSGWGQPDALLAQARRLFDPTAAAPATELQALLERVLNQRDAELAALKVPCVQWADELEALLDQAVEQGVVDKRKIQKRYYAPWFETLRQWALTPEQIKLELPPAAWARLSEDGLGEAWKKGAVPDHPALRGLPQLREALAALPNPDSDALRHAADWMSVRFEAEKRRRAQMGFDDMLTRLDAALQGPNGDRLAEVIRQQFPVALIDEFQDTDPLQYRIFDRIYRVAENDQDCALLLIGDPKQAIYAFRGADIHTYLRARGDTAGRHENLDTNFRSSQTMVTAVNRVFEQAEQNFAAGAFLFRKADDNPMPFLPVGARGRKEVWCSDGEPAPALTAWLLESEEPLSGDVYRREMAERCASEMTALLQAGQQGRAGFARDGEPFAAVRPADMAVLVRTGREAQLIRDALAARGVRSVYLSDKDSVLATQQAQDVLRWLRACAEPGNDRLLRAALASHSLHLNWQALDQLNQDERLWEQRVDQFRDYRRIWQRQGVLPMLHRLLHDFELPARLQQQDDGERALTNLLHLAELLQRAARELDGEQALIRHLAELIRQADEGAADEQVLRLESDAELVKVVTIHKSKGLEYPLVFLPFICLSRPVRADQPLRLSDGWVLKPDADQVAEADRERLGEDLRLLYVALTRAQHACWLGMADLKSGNNKQSVLHRSAIAWLLGGGAALDSSIQLKDWLARWQPDGEVVALQGAPEPRDDRLPLLDDGPALVDARRPAHGRFDAWWIGSYSALALSGESTDSALAEWIADDERQSRFVPLRRGEQPSIHRFPRGPQPGTFLHGLLELAAQEGFSALQDAERCRRWLSPRCQRRGWGEWSECLSEWLGQLLQRPGLVPGTELALGELPQSRYQSEMAFMFAASKVDVQQIDRLVTAMTLDGLPRPTLQRDRLNGLFKGYIDLVLEHEGRYYVLDYKSNWLGATPADYSEAAMSRALLEHRYDLQYVFYLLALHRQLQARLPDYDYDRHIGGALYWFMRGVDAENGGLCHQCPPRELIETLDRLFAGQPVEEIDHAG